MYICPISNSQTIAAICDELSSHEWDAVVSCCNNDVQLLYDAIIDKVNLSIGHHVPPKPIYSKPAIPYNVRQLLKEKKRLYSVSKAAYKEVSKNYDQAVKLWCDKIENAICENPNSAKFYGFAKNKLKSLEYNVRNIEIFLIQNTTCFFLMLYLLVLCVFRHSLL